VIVRERPLGIFGKVRYMTVHDTEFSRVDVRSDILECVVSKRLFFVIVSFFYIGLTIFLNTKFFRLLHLFIADYVDFREY